MSSLIQFLYLSLFFATPFLFTSFTSELFEIPKMYFVYLLTLFIIFSHLANWIKGKTPLLVKNKLLLPFSLFFLSQLISTFFSVDPHTSIFGYYSRLNGGLLSLFSYFSLFLILPQYLSSSFRHKIIRISLISGLLVSSFGILEHFGIDKNLWVQDVQSRVFSTLGQPNWLAAYLCILLPFALHQLLNSKSKLLFTIHYLLVINYYLCLLFTKSKSGMVAGIISIGIYFMLYISKNINLIKIKSRFTKGSVRRTESFLILITFAILSITINNPIKDYLFSTHQNSNYNELQNPTYQNNTLNITPSEDIRKIVWQGSVDLWKRFPFSGTGPETFAYSYYWTRPATHNLTSEWDFLYNKAHNEYLNYLATTGTFGFLTYIFFIISVIYSLLKSPLSKGNSVAGQDGLSLAIFASFISILITNFAGFSVVITSLFFFLLPTFNSPEISTKTTLKPKNKWLFFLLITIFLFLLIKILSFLVADIAYNQSQNTLNHQQITTAQGFINTALYLRPKEAIYHSQSSLIAAKLNQPSLAISHSNLAITLSPASTNLWKERAQVFSLLSLLDPQYFNYAIDALEKCARLAPTDAKTFYLLGKFYEAASEKDLAVKNYQQALTLKPNYDYATFNLGKTYFLDKNYSEAKKYFEITLEYAPGNTDAQNYLDKIISLSPKLH